jgi:pimeloyl-ACP methyl ester carboxylesterase
MADYFKLRPGLFFMSEFFFRPSMRKIRNNKRKFNQMEKAGKIRITLIVLIILCLSTSIAQEIIEGDWIGEFTIAEKSTYFRACFKSEGKMIKGTLDFPLQNLTKQDLSQVRLDSLHVHFELSKEKEALIFDGKLEKERLSGTVKQGEQQGTFELIHIAKVDQKIYEQYIGDYELGPNIYVSIFKTAQAAEEGQFSFHDFGSGRIGNLFPLSETTFFTGPSFTVNYPIDIKATFVKDDLGKVSDLIWEKPGIQKKSAPKVQLYTEEEVTFHNGDVTLAGVVKVPVTVGPHPAVVLIHGSGAGSREQLTILAHFFVHEGFAVLSFDKRGCGASTGDWRRADFDDLAGDILAGVEFLQEYRNIYPKQVGLWGISQGGWIAPLSASFSKEIAFIISHSGPGVTPAQQELYRLENLLPKVGFSKEEVTKILEVYELLFEFVKTGKKGERLDTSIIKLREDPKLSRLLPPLSQNIKAEELYEKQPIGDPGWYLHLNIDFDPGPVYEKVTCPVLAIFGKYDFTLPVEESAERIEAALKVSGNTDYTIKILSNAGHGILEMKGSALSDFVSPPKAAHGYFEMMADWLQKRFGKLKDS